MDLTDIFPCRRKRVHPMGLRPRRPCQRSVFGSSLAIRAVRPPVIGLGFGPALRHKPLGRELPDRLRYGVVPRRLAL